MAFPKFLPPQNAEKISSDLFGALGAVLVALPSAIAYGLVIYGPLGSEFAGIAVIAGITGTIFLGLLASIFGGTPGLISAPCAPAAAILSVFALELLKIPNVTPFMIPGFLAIAGAIAGLLQLITGALGGGRLIKYIPYPVVAGYLGGVGILIILGQIPKFFGFDKSLSVWQGVTSVERWQHTSLVVGAVTIVSMLLAPKVFKKIPAAIVALAMGVATYFALSFFYPELRSLDHNKEVIGVIHASASDLSTHFLNHLRSIFSLPPAILSHILIPSVTLAILLSIDTLKTCVILDVMTESRHNSNRELIGQGIGNTASAFLGGLPGAGTMGATLVNHASGGRTRFSGIFEGVFAVAILLLLARFIAWIPIAALAGILIVVGFRMIDLKSLQLLKHRSTTLDFVVILAVIISALSFSLLVASGVGIGVAIFLFLREQINISVIRRKLTGSQIFSKKRRLSEELKILETYGKSTTICELQGQLFFGTADQLYTELENTTFTSKRIVIDMKRVRSIDYTAVNMLKQIYRKILANQGTLAISSLPLNLPSGVDMKEYLADLGFDKHLERLLFFDNLEAALLWSEEILLKEHDSLRDTKPLELLDFSLFSEMPHDAIEEIQKSIEVRNYYRDDIVFAQEDKSDELYFIRSGIVKIELLLADGSRHMLATFQRGDFFGEMSFLDKERRSADALAECDTTIYVFSRQKIREFSRKFPDMGALLFERIARELSLRLRLIHIELKALQEN